MNLTTVLKFRPTDGPVVQLTGYKTTANFQIPDRYLKLLDASGEVWYSPLDVVGSEYDSGLRVKIGDQVYQASSSCIFNVLDRKLTANNLIVNMDSLNRIFLTLRYVFGNGRVKLGNGYVRFVAPSLRSGVTRFLLIGSSVRIETEDGMTLTTYRNGWNLSSVGGERQRVGRLLMIRLVPQRSFLIRVDESAVTQSTDAVVNAMILGTTVEAMPDEAASVYERLKHNGFCRYDTTLGRMVSATTDVETTFVLDEMVGYAGGAGTYSLIDLQSMGYKGGL